MKKVINEIHIVPAIFDRYREDGNIILRCLQGNSTVLRAFEPKLFKDFAELKYVLLGIIAGVGEMRLNVCDGQDFEELYREHWNVLLK